MSITTKILLFAIVLLFILLIAALYLLYREIRINDLLEEQKKWVEMDREKWKESYEEVNSKYQDLKRERKAK